MKRIVIILSLGCVVMSSCTEKSPIIQFAPQAPRTDTTYMLTSIPVADPHNVLIEDFTGGSCTNCPGAHDIIKNLAITNPGRVNGIALFVFVPGFLESEPVHGSRYDFRTTAGTQIMSSVYQPVNLMPTGGVDRQPEGDNSSAPLQCDYTKWPSYANSMLGITDSVNLSVVSSYDAVNQKAKIKVAITYLQATSEVQNISLAIVEDSLIDFQDDNHLPPPYLDSFYHFNNVFRGSVTTAPFGDKIAPQLTTKEKGLVYERTYSYDWNPAWNPNNCRVIGFITRGDASGGANVYQSVQAKIKP